MFCLIGRVIIGQGELSPVPTSVGMIWHEAVAHIKLAVDAIIKQRVAHTK